MVNPVNPSDPLDHTMTVYPATPFIKPDSQQLAEPPTLVLALIGIGTLAAFGFLRRLRGTATRRSGRSGTKIPVPQFEKPAAAPGEAAKRAA